MSSSKSSKRRRDEFLKIQQEREREGVLPNPLMEAEDEEDFFGSASFSGGDIRTHIHMMEDNGNGKDERENTSMGNGHKEKLVIKRSVEGERENGGEDNGGGGISRNIGGGGNEDDVLVLNSYLGF